MEQKKSNIPLILSSLIIVLLLIFLAVTTLIAVQQNQQIIILNAEVAILRDEATNLRAIAIGDELTDPNEVVDGTSEVTKNNTDTSKVCSSNLLNIKVTTPEDWDCEATADDTQPYLTMTKENMEIKVGSRGIGFFCETNDCVYTDIINEDKIRLTVAKSKGVIVSVMGSVKLGQADHVIVKKIDGNWGSTLKFENEIISILKSLTAI